MSVRKLRDAVVLMAAFVALIWILQVLNWADGYRLDAEYGILPHNAGRLPEIFTAPFLHVSWQHIEGNTLPLFVLGVLAAYRGIRKFLLLTLIVAVTSGLAVWLFQSGNTLTVGASGLIFGYFGYVVIRGFFDRNLLDIGIGIVAGVLYWTILQVAIPGTPGISWIDHIGGLVGGVVAAWVLREHSAAVGAAAHGWTTGFGRPLRAGQRDRAPGTAPSPANRTAANRTAANRTAANRTATEHPGSRAARDLLRELEEKGL
jgi:membrane associated rhomboid family serine protease